MLQAGAARYCCSSRKECHRPTDRLATRAKFGEFLKQAYRAGALAVIGGQGGSKAAGMHLTHTGMLGVDVQFDIPVVSMAAEDQSQLERYLERGESARLHLTSRIGSRKALCRARM
jgi:hypothetical protein